jgi:hypothetical protein
MKKKIIIKIIILLILVILFLNFKKNKKANIEGKRMNNPCCLIIAAIPVKEANKINTILDFFSTNRRSKYIVNIINPDRKISIYILELKEINFVEDKTKIMEIREMGAFLVIFLESKNMDMLITSTPKIEATFSPKFPYNPTKIAWKKKNKGGYSNLLSKVLFSKTFIVILA